jgi:hypothetical protein
MQRKNIFSLLPLFALALFVFTGCNKEKDVAPSTEKYIGVWKLDKYTYSMIAGGTSEPWSTTTGTTQTVEFKADGKIVDKDISGTETIGTWKLESNKMIVTFPSETTTDEIESGTYEVKTITDTNLVLYQKKVQTVFGITVGDETTIAYKK